MRSIRWVLWIFMMQLAACSLIWKNTKASDTLPLEVQQANCAKLDSQQMGANIASIVFGGLAGASGLTSIVVSDNQSVVYAMGGVALGVTIGGGISTYLATTFTQRFCRLCANIVPPTP